MPGFSATLRPQRLLDLGEQGAALALYAWLAARMWPAEFSPENWYAILLLLSEGMVVLLLLLRRPVQQMSHRFTDWVVALLGTLVALMAVRGSSPILPVAGLALMLAGLAIQVGAKLNLMRSFGLVAANRGLKTNGLYGLVRHPMYAGYMIAHVGFLLSSPAWWNLAVYLTVWLLLIARIGMEERVLRADAAWSSYASRVHWRLAPGVW